VIERAPDRVSSELAELRTLSEKALHQVRNILFFLRPLILEKEGLGPALSYYAERMRPLERFDLTLDVASLKTRLDTEVESNIFAIVQEAVSNAKRHALPHHVWIQGGEKEGQLVLTVRDDGCGFDPAQAERAAAERNSFGLLNMRERAELARATLVIESEPGRGTRITLRVPLPGSEKEKG
jgi:two-component system sensor histidine kinase DegS